MLECAICYDDGDDGDFIILDQCTHSFHKKCIVNWQRRKLTCPLCRNAFSYIGSNRMFEFIDTEDLQRLDTLLHTGCIDMIGEEGFTPLTYSISLGSSKVIALLISRGCDLNKVDGNDQTPLECAVLSDELYIAEELIRLGVSIPDTLLEDAIITDSNCFELVANEVKTIDPKSLIIACEFNNMRAIRYLVTNPRIDINYANQNEKTALFYTLDVDALLLLLEHGADPYHISKNHMNFLMHLGRIKDEMDCMHMIRHVCNTYHLMDTLSLDHRDIAGNDVMSYIRHDSVKGFLKEIK
jgi:hypothetical protein